MAVIRKIKDGGGNTIYPITVSEAVLLNENENLTNLVQKVNYLLGEENNNYCINDIYGFEYVVHYEIEAFPDGDVQTGRFYHVLHAIYFHSIGRQEILTKQKPTSEPTYSGTIIGLIKLGNPWAILQNPRKYLKFQEDDDGSNILYSSYLDSGTGVVQEGDIITDTNVSWEEGKS